MVIAVGPDELFPVLPLPLSFPPPPHAVSVRASASAPPARNPRNFIDFLLLVSCVFVHSADVCAFYHNHVPCQRMAINVDMAAQYMPGLCVLIPPDPMM
jgi:hypothetical protein